MTNLDPEAAAKPKPPERVSSAEASLLSRLYPEMAAGGFTHDDHRIVFYARVNALLDAEMTVLDFGCGRGKWAEIESSQKRKLTTLRGKCKRVIGADVDPVGVENPLIDDWIQIAPDGRLALPDNSVDIIVSWAVFEHVVNAEATARELERILKPGGFICAWTPNKWSYFALGARLVPNRLHYRFLRYLGVGLRHEVDVFPTAYNLNTLADLRRRFPAARFDNCSYRYSGPPSYTANRMLVARVWQFWAWLMPSYFAQTIHVFLQKK